MKWALIIIGSPFALIAVIALAGLALPQSHVASRTARINQPPAAIWTAITNIGESPSWRKDVRSIEMRPSKDGKPAWVEHGSSGAIPLAIVEAVPPARLVTRIDATDLAFGGTWTYELKEDAGATLLTITERGDVYNPIFRALARYAFGHTATIDAYLKNLGKKFGQEIVLS
jgi:uncharacterized protein YndB with AHSA1/START domain